MISFQNPIEAKLAIMTYAAKSGSLAPDDLRLALIKITAEPSPVTAVVDGAELLYARAGVLDGEGRALAASLASYAAQWAWHGMQVEERGMRMAQAMQRDNGIEGVWPDAETDPAVDSRFVPISMPVLPPPPSAQ